MAIQWPDTIPQQVLYEGLQIQEASGTIRQDMSVGPVNVRSRTASTYRKMTAEIVCTQDQLQDFIYFVEITIRQGALPFNWTDPIQGTSNTFRFLEPPKWVPYGHRYRVSLALEMRVIGGV